MGQTSKIYSAQLKRHTFKITFSEIQYFYLNFHILIWYISLHWTRVAPFGIIVSVTSEYSHFILGMLISPKIKSSPFTSLICQYNNGFGEMKDLSNIAKNYENIIRDNCKFVT